MRFKPIFTWSAPEKKARLLRIYWADDYRVLSLALMPKVFAWKDYGVSKSDVRLVLLGISFHYMRSFSGRFA